MPARHHQFAGWSRLLSRVSPGFLWTEQARTVRGTSSVFFRLPTFHFAMEQNIPTYKVENNEVEFRGELDSWRLRRETETLL
jgi:hypothetical protein